MSAFLNRLSVIVAVLIVAWATAVLAVGMVGLGVPVPFAMLAAMVGGVALAVWLRPHVQTALETVAADFGPYGRALWLTVTTVAAMLGVGTILRLAIFMADPARVEHSLIPSDLWRLAHSCVSAYTEAVRFATSGDRNIYDAGQYLPNRIGIFRVDSYHYPPPFLLLPWTLGMVAPTFVAFRSIWFTLEAIVLAIALVAIGRWIGGTRGLWAMAASALVLITPSVIRTLQMGNVQMMVVPLAIIALVLADGGRATTGRTIAGGSLLAYAALSKIFPGALVLLLMASRRWRAVISVAIASVLFVGATILVFGWRPFTDFIGYELPLIASAEAFPQTQNPRTIVNNLSVYGLTGKLRMLGLSWLTPETGLTIASVYGVVVILLVAAAGWRTPLLPATSEGRLARAQLWLAVLTLASLRSPFAPMDYAPIASLWLLALLAAGASSPLGRTAWLLAFTTLAGAGLLQRPPTVGPPSNVEFVFWTFVGGGVLLLNLSVVTRVLMGRQGVRLPLRDAAGILPQRSTVG